MRVAYLLMVHRKPRQIRALLRSFPEDSPVFVHVDARVRASVVREIAALRAEREFTLVRRHRCYWGRIGMVRATLELVSAAIASDERWEYASLLSGSDYPIKSNEDISRYLDDHRGGEFISLWDMRGPNPWSEAPGRFQADSRVDRRHIGAGRRILRLPGKRTMPLGLQAYGGSQWWTLSRGALEHVISFVAAQPSFLRFMRGVFVPDECFFQTLLANSSYKEHLTGQDLRYIDWSRPEPPRPAVLVSSDLVALSAVPHLYARKFDLDADPHVLENIESTLRRH